MADATAREEAPFCRPLRIYWGAGDDEIGLDPEELRKLLDDENLATGERFADAFYSLCWETKFGAPYPPAWWRGVNRGLDMFFDPAGQPKASARWEYLFKESLESRTRHLGAQWLQVCDADSCEGIPCRKMRAEVERLLATCQREGDSPSPASEIRRAINQAGEERDPLPKGPRNAPTPSSQESEKATAEDAGGDGVGAAHRMEDGHGNEKDRSHPAAAFEWAKDEMPRASADPPSRILVNMPADAIRCHLSCVLQLAGISNNNPEFRWEIDRRRPICDAPAFQSWICDAVSAGIRLVSHEFPRQVAVEAEADREQKTETFLVSACGCVIRCSSVRVRVRLEELLVQVARAGFPSHDYPTEYDAVRAHLPRLVGELFATEGLRSRYTKTFLNGNGEGQLQRWLRDVAEAYAHSLWRAEHEGRNFVAFSTREKGKAFGTRLLLEAMRAEFQQHVERAHKKERHDGTLLRRRD